MPTPQPTVATQETAQTVNKDLLLRYAWLKTEIKKLETEEKMLHDQVEAQVREFIGDSDEQLALQEYPGCAYILAKARPKWQYSQTVQDVMADLKEMQKKEEQTDAAINLNDGKKELRFNQPKAE